jgi:DNA-binding phage protein
MKKEIIISRFDASDYLDSEEAIAEYLEAITEENLTLLASAMKDVEKARSRMMFHEMTQPGRVGNVVLPTFLTK